MEEGVPLFPYFLSDKKSKMFCIAGNKNKLLSQEEKMGSRYLCKREGWFSSTHGGIIPLVCKIRNKGLILLTECPFLITL